MITTTLTVLALAIAPTVEFTSDSTYKKNSILDFSVAESAVVETDDDTGFLISEERSYTLNVKENYTLGYDIYDDPNTAYIDGVKVDGVFLATDWCVENFDLDANHVVTVKTVYSDDVAGWFAMAKNGDFSALISNPITIMQIFYYSLAALSIILGGFGLLKSKKHKAKSANEIAAIVSNKAEILGEIAEKGIQDAEVHALSLVTDIVTPLVDTLSKQNDTLIKATVLARNGDEESTLALLELLKNSGTQGIGDISEAVRKRITESKAAAEDAKAKAVKAMKEAVSEVTEEVKKPTTGYDGTSI